MSYTHKDHIKYTKDPIRMNSDLWGKGPMSTFTKTSDNKKCDRRVKRHTENQNLKIKGTEYERKY